MVMSYIKYIIQNMIPRYHNCMCTKSKDSIWVIDTFVDNITVHCCNSDLQVSSVCVQTTIAIHSIYMKKVCLPHLALQCQLLLVSTQLLLLNVLSSLHSAVLSYHTIVKNIITYIYIVSNNKITCMFILLFM